MLKKAQQTLGNLWDWNSIHKCFLFKIIFHLFQLKSEVSQEHEREEILTLYCVLFVVYCYISAINSLLIIIPHENIFNGVNDLFLC